MSAMNTNPQQPPGRDDVISSLNEAIDALDLPRDTLTGAKPVKDAFDCVCVLLGTIKDTTIDQTDCVKLGLACADVCKSLRVNQVIDGAPVDQPSESTLRAIEQFTATVAEIQKHIVQRGKRNVTSQHSHVKDDEKVMAAWGADLDRIRRIFVIELDILGSREDADDQNQATYSSVPKDPTPPPPGTTPGATPDIDREVTKIITIASKVKRDIVRMRMDVLKLRQEHENRNHVTQNSMPGESPPPPPRIFFGRDVLVQAIVDLVERLTPIGLIGTGGIGKTSIALTVLHDNRIKERFGDNRRFIRCDQFPPSLAHFLRRLSEVIGAGIENPEDLASLRPFLSSREMLIIIDNADVLIGQQGMDAQGIYSALEELSRFKNICLCITSRISTLPPGCETFEVPTLSMDAARDTFYRIYRHGERSDSANNILEQLEFHPLSITLLATVGHQNKWGVDRLIKEWEKRRTGVLETRHKASLAATIELSLTSPMFQELGPHAPGILGVIAFYPQGVDENNLDWLFPTTSNAAEIFDGFCVLSLTYRSDNFLTMLAPLRDYLSPKAPLSSPFLYVTKDRYFARLSVILDTNRPEFGEGRWIVAEDVNVEHLLDVFASIDAKSDDVWEACIKFMSHLHAHKPRRVVLGRRVEELPDGHLLKADCLLWLSALAERVGDRSGCDELFDRSLRLWKATGDPQGTAVRLRYQSSANSGIGLHAEAIQQAREALEICEKLGDTIEQAESSIYLALALASDNQLEAAEESASRAITLLPKDYDQFLLSNSHSTLGGIYRSMGDNAKAIEHFEKAFEITMARDWHIAVSTVAADLVTVLTREHRLDEANTYIERAKPRVAQANSPMDSARLMIAQSMIWSEQRRFEEAVSELSEAVDLFEKLGATADAEKWRTHLDVLKLIRDVSSASFLDADQAGIPSVG